MPYISLRTRVQIRVYCDRAGGVRRGSGEVPEGASGLPGVARTLCHGRSGVPFRITEETEADGKPQKFHTIVAMPEYKTKCPEEL
eukprot:8337996-Pyramimonas_sp.AAC.1